MACAIYVGGAAIYNRI